MSTKLTPQDIDIIKTGTEEAINLVKYYASQYKGGEHYDILGAKCVMSATSTINTIINSAEYLDKAFLMPDEIHVERLVDWFINNKNYECDRDILTFYAAHYLKRKINHLYKSINRNANDVSIILCGSEELKKKYMTRKNLGVKLIRL